MRNLKLFTTMLAFGLFLFSNTANAQTQEAGVTVIELNQIDGAFETTDLKLAPGKYQFKVTNKVVDKEVGFVIQKASDKDGDVMKTAVENSFTTALIKKGNTEYSGVVELTAGEYVYSCPLNPTPKYTLTVK